MATPWRIMAANMSHGGSRRSRWVKVSKGGSRWAKAGQDGPRWAKAGQGGLRQSKAGQGGSWLPLAALRGPRRVKAACKGNPLTGHGESWRLLGVSRRPLGGPRRVKAAPLAALGMSRRPLSSPRRVDLEEPRRIKAGQDGPRKVMATPWRVMAAKMSHGGSRRSRGVKEAQGGPRRVKAGQGRSRRVKAAQDGPSRVKVAPWQT
ncbi:hypothetical protein ACLB2K_021155 [Fragaria x ananassa]